MCQLLGMNCNSPTDICFSFTGFRARGGLTDVHQDGWGIAFFERKGVRLFLDPEASARSPVAELVRLYPIHSTNVIAHIRKATQGEVCLENTHPFLRELWGYNWVFAHNGTLKDYHPELDGSFRPIGTTDSERAFCWMLQEMRREFGDQAPDDERLFDFVRRASLDLGARGAFNFLLSNGRVMLAHASTRLSSVVRQAPFRCATLKDEDVSVDFNALARPKDRVAIIATTPLTNDEPWSTFAPGTLWMFLEGAPVRSARTVPGPANAEADEAG